MHFAFFLFPFAFVRILRPIPAERLRLVIFDLDGTLIDSRIDLANSINAMLAH